VENSSGAKSGRDENGQLWIDLTEVSELVNKLETPTRVFQYRIGPVVYRLLRGADDATPDNVVQFGGLYHNLDTGHVGRELKDVVDKV
jgi:hypothetical protein